MKSLFYLILFIPIITLSQSKKDTEKWIISKFDKWETSIIKYDDSTYEVFNTRGPFKYMINFNSLKVDGCNLIIEDVTITYPNRTGVLSVRTIKIGDIEEIKWFDNRLFIKSRKWNINVKKYDSDTKKYLSEDYVQGALLSFKTNAEKDLKNRLTKAFKHLKTYCEPSIDEKETF